MRALFVAVLAVACGGESGAAFDRELPVDVAGATSTLGGSAPMTTGGSGTGGSDALPSAGNDAGGAGSVGGGQTIGGSAGSPAAGAGGSAMDQAGAGGSIVDPVGGQSGGGAGGNMTPVGGAGGKPPTEDVPAACEACRDDHLFFCDVSAVHPNGACLRCSDDGIPGNDLYRDCDGPGAEHYVSKNDHDPGYGCETFVGLNGSCPQ